MRDGRSRVRGDRGARLGDWFADGVYWRDL